MRSMSRLAILCFAVAVLVAPVTAQQRAGEQGVLSNSGRLLLSYSSELVPVQINTIHNWVLHVELSTGEVVENAQISLAGGMTEHDHGLPTAPRMTRYLGDGDYLMEGVRFHMNGRWVVTVQVDYGELSDSVVFELEI